MTEHDQIGPTTKKRLEMTGISEKPKTDKQSIEGPNK